LPLLLRKTKPWKWQGGLDVKKPFDLNFRVKYNLKINIGYNFPKISESNAEVASI
jgi:hypothetical protein